MSYNTIIPTSYLRDVPMLFLEARIHGSAKELVSQMGISMNTTQCDVGLMTRTSGVFIIAGVSSYCAYKLCGKLLGRRFVWRLLDSHPLNVTPQTTFISSNSTLFEAPDQLYCQLLSSDNEKESDDEECVTLFPDNESPLKGAKKYHVDLTSPASDLRRKGLAALSIVDSDEFGKGVSILDRPVKGIALKENVNSKYAVSNSACSEHDNGSVKSAAFNLTWDTEPLWDDEFFGLSPKSHIQNKIERIEEDGIRSTTSSAFIFSTLLNDKDDGDSIFKATSCSVHESEKEDEIMVSENNSITMEDLSSIINSKCMNDSQHLYRSVIVATSDAAKSMSICSSKSNISKINERFLRKNNGLMELTPASCSNNLEPSPMTDSCISKISFTSSSAVSKPHLTPTTQPCHRQMFDSAIVPDFVSDTGSSSTKSFCNQVNNNVVQRSPTNVMNRNSIGSTLPARVINNFTGSIAGKSMQSLEWCDETFEEGSSVNNSWDQEEGLFNLGVDHSTYYPRQNVGSSSDTYSETSKYSEPPKTQALTIPSKLPEPLHLPHSSVDLRLTGTRDLMVVIREHFKSAETTKLKLANMIYGKKRLRRVKESDSKYRNLTFDGFLQASLHAMLFSNAPFFNCSSFEVIEKSATKILQQFDYLRRWNLVSSRSGKTSIKPSNHQLEQEMIGYLAALWKLQHDVSGLAPIKVSEEAVEGAKLLMVLKSINIHSTSFETTSYPTPRDFYPHLFSLRHPKQIMTKVNSFNSIMDPFDLALFADTVNIKMEVFDLSPSHLTKHNMVALYPDNKSKYHTTISLIRLIDDGPILPLYYVADESFY